MNLKFENLECVVNIVCISEDGEIDSFDDIITEIKDGLDDVFGDIMERRNNVVAFELSDITGFDNGVDKED